MKYKYTNDPYQFDLDENNMIALTKHNVEFINAILAIDSAYKTAELGIDKDSAKYLFKKYGITTDYDKLVEQIRAVNKENSTHLAASGTNKGDNEGIEITAKCISEIKNLKSRLINADKNLVNEIAQSNPKRNNFSFASKFCTYASRYALNLDNYSIYDQVLSDVLPYYAKVYLNKRYIKRTNSTVPEQFKDQCDYAGYISLIDNIIEKANEELGYKISHKDFDHLIWYYYKGNEKERVSNVAELINRL